MAEISYEIIQYNTARQNYALFLTEHKLPSVLYSWERNFGSFVGFSRLPITETPPRMAQHCGPTAAVAVVSRDPTFVPRTPATSPENNRRVHLSLVCPRRGLVTGACAREGGKCRSTGAVVGRRRPTVQSLRHARHCCWGRLRVNRHTRPSAIVDRGRHAVAAAESLLPTRCPQPIASSQSPPLNM